ncbi:Bgt-51482 [Blumeria graminis f. sp. tritici]|uniref:Bgt-51482 n=1 Tax=Blumeria graminis f. sp. tritici TaxID=62690 RepID=A0A9X9MHV1_BLUGR|nr:Bgt-51482 [Blumeria graminis f. sp. tritici]
MIIEWSIVTKFKSATEATNNEKIKVTLTEALKSETSGKLFRDFDKFWNVYFGKNRLCSSVTRRIWESFINNDQFRPEKISLCDMDEKGLRSWLQAFRELFLNILMKAEDFTEIHQPAVKSGYHEPIVQRKLSQTTKVSQLNSGLSDQGKPFLIESSEIPDCEIHKWKDVRVIGLITSSEDQIAVKVNKMASYARKIFYSQLLCQFLHGICLQKNNIEFWIADWAGAYSFVKKDVIESQEKLVRGLSFVTKQVVI